MLQLDSPWRLGSTTSAGAGRAGIQKIRITGGRRHALHAAPKRSGQHGFGACMGAGVTAGTAAEAQPQKSKAKPSTTWHRREDCGPSVALSLNVHCVGGAGQRAWPASMVSEHGQRAWSASMVSEFGERVW